MSMWKNFILININIMDMKVHLFIKIFIFMLVSREKKNWDNYKNGDNY
jgi:hypothetical protein